MKLTILLVLLLGLGLTPAGADDKKPAPKLPLGKETTYVTGPIDKDGYVDFEAALNDRLGKGITPEKNANVLLWKALGPTPDSDRRQPPEYFKRLGMEEPPKEGDYFIKRERYAKEHLKKVEQAELDSFNDEMSAAIRRAWTAKDHPHVAAWLKANKNSLALVVEATKRPEYFNPLVPHRKEDGPGLLNSAYLPSVQSCREPAMALAARALLRVGEGKFDAAWEDILSCHRLGRLVGRGGLLIEGLIGYTIQQFATDAALVYLARAPLTSKQLIEHLKELQSLPPTPHPTEKVELGERLMCLDSIQHVRRSGFDVLRKEPSAPEPCDPLDMLDWGPALRTCNMWYDRRVVAMHIKDYSARQKEFDKIEAELAKAARSAGNLDDLIQKLQDGGDAMAEISTRVGHLFTNLLLSSGVRRVQDRFDLVQQEERNLRVAFALAAYKADTGKYPAKLDDLAPKYIATLPGDVFSGKALIYKPSEKGYLFYSVGQNGIDEGGRYYDDEPRGDDPRVRMPLPPLKKAP